jgi:imidazole glycerol phosphate synthase glutamine amidotransferase subunit
LPVDIEEADGVVLPGVGAFGAAMRKLNDSGWTEPLRARLAAGRPTLAICLGLQILCEASEESPGVKGLGVIPGVVRRFPNTVRVPQMGWNLVEPEQSPRLPPAGSAYFANSYRLDARPDGWSAAWSDYGGRFIAMLARGPILACQFHPELSGAWGLDLLRGWLAAVDEDLR